MCTQRYSALTVILQMSDHKKKSQSVITAEKLKVNVKTHVVSNLLKTRKSRQEEPQEIYKLNQILHNKRLTQEQCKRALAFPLSTCTVPRIPRESSLDSKWIEI